MMRLRYNRGRKERAGFTLVETLVAITVLLLVIVGPITVAQKGIKSALYANEQVTAVFLAQEAIEAVRELRDSQALDAYESTAVGDTTWTWKDALPAECETTGCAYDITSGDFETCGSNNNCRLRIDVASGKYSYAVGNDSPFTRRIYMDDSVAGAISLRVEVTWVSTIFGGSTVRDITLETWLYDHYRRYDDQP